MRLVPRQLRRSDFPSSVPYYGGRLTPNVIRGLGHQTPPQYQTAPMGAQPLPGPAPAPNRSLAALDELHRTGVLTDAEYATYRQRIGPS